MSSSKVWEIRGRGARERHAPMRAFSGPYLRSVDRCGHAVEGWLMTPSPVEINHGQEPARAGDDTAGGVLCLVLMGVATLCLLAIMPTGCTAIKEHVATRHIHHGERLMEVKDIEAALVEFEKAAEIAPHLAVAHSKMGIIYRGLGDYATAISCFVEALRRDPFSFSNTFDLAQLYYLTDRVREALQAYVHATELDPLQFDAQLNLGVCYQQLGDLSQAVQRFHNAIDIDPDRPHAYINLGVALDAEGKYYEAVRAYKEALERDSHQPLVMVNLAHTYMNQDRMLMARRALQEAIRMDSGLAVSHEALGYCLFRTRDFGAAERAYTFALSCDRHLPRSHAGLGSIKMLRFLDDETRADLRDTALEHWHRSLELNPDQPRIRNLIAQYKPKRSNPGALLLGVRAGR